VVALECALEGAATTCRAANGIWLLGTVAQAVVVHHQVVGFLLVLLAAPDPPSNETQTSQDDRTADANDYTDDSGPRLRRHARSLVVAVATTLETGRRGRGRDHLSGIHDTIRVSSCDDRRDSRLFLFL
jgi:hypothetical protein